MNEPPDDWLRRLFEYGCCPECSGDAEDHEVCFVPGIGNYFARCKRSPFADPGEEGHHDEGSTADGTDPRRWGELKELN